MQNWFQSLWSFCYTLRCQCLVLSRILVGKCWGLHSWLWQLLEGKDRIIKKCSSVSKEAHQHPSPAHNCSSLNYQMCPTLTIYISVYTKFGTVPFMEHVITCLGKWKESWQILPLSRLRTKTTAWNKSQLKYIYVYMYTYFKCITLEILPVKIYLSQNTNLRLCL